MHITYELMQRGAKLDLAGCLKMEYGIVQNIMVRLVGVEGSAVCPHGPCRTDWTHSHL
jgi:hypothetical protein